MKKKIIKIIVLLSGLFIIIWMTDAAIVSSASTTQFTRALTELQSDSITRMIVIPLLTGILYLITQFAAYGINRAGFASHWQDMIYFFEDVNDVVLAVDLKGKITYINAPFRTISGFSTDEIIGKHYSKFISMESASVVDKNFYKGIIEDISTRYTIDFISRDGTATPIELNMVSMKDDSGRITGRLGIARDISQRVEIEQALKESEEKFRNMAESTPSAIMMYQDDRFIYCNKAAEVISGYTFEELKLMKFWDFVAPEYQELIAERGKRRQEGKGAPSNYEFKIRQKSGKDIWVTLSGATTQLSGKPAGIISVIDINERKLYEEALRQSEEKHRTILENIEDGYFEVDIAGNITMFNERLNEMFGYTPEEIEGINYKKFTDSESQKEVYNAFNTLYTTEAPVKFTQFNLIRKDNSLLPLEVSISLIRNSTGEITGFRGIARDISSRKRMEEELIHAHKMQAVGTLAGGMAHDFNNLLMAIQGNITMIGKSTTNKKRTEERVQNIKECVISGADITKQLLNFARGQEKKFITFPINDLVERSTKLFSQAHKEITTTLTLGNESMYLDGDRGQIEQVLINLYVNSHHAMPLGGELNISTTVKDVSFDITEPHNVEPGKFILVRVTDTGTGMDSETVQRIFEPFFSSRDTSHGSGLGLASAYGIIRSHKGFITVTSRKGKGTTFDIYLPLSASETGEDHKEPEEAIEHGTGRVMVVDDEKHVLVATGEMLTSLGYEVISFRKGSEAMDHLTRDPQSIDLVLLDMVMPEMSGTEFFAKLKEIDRNIPVVLSSGYSDAGAAEEIMKLGCNEFLQKPYDLSSLSHMVYKHKRN